MSSRTINLDDALYAYLLDSSLREDGILRQLREETAQLPNAQMQISPEQGQFMALLAELTGAETALEIGVFTGYSALCVARAMGPKGRMICCDVNRDWTDMGRRAWRKAGVEARIELHLAPALTTLDRLLGENAAGSIDLAFIDADKENYAAYYERCLELLRPGGLIMIDNTLWSGAVIDPEKQDPDTAAIRILNARLVADTRISLSMLPIGDGLTLCRKRP